MRTPVATVILANLMSSKGELNAETKARIDLAVKLDAALKSDVILLCGWAYRSDCSLTIADAMKAYALAQYPGLAKKLICQKLSRDTGGDAIFCRLYLRELFISQSSFNLNVVTSDYHSKRTCEIFNFTFGTGALITVYGAPGFASEMSTTKERQSLEEFRKTFSNASAGDLDSIYLSLANWHPFYNGVIHPQIEKINQSTWQVKSYLATL